MILHEVPSVIMALAGGPEMLVCDLVITDIVMLSG
jgi:hypothetical protein